KTSQSLRNLQQGQLQQFCHGKHGKSVVHVVSSAHFKTTLAGKNAVAVQRKGCFPSYMNVFCLYTAVFPEKYSLIAHFLQFRRQNYLFTLRKQCRKCLLY